MKRLTIATTLVVVLLALFAAAAPAAFAAEPFQDTGSTLVAVNRNVDIPAGDRLETLVVAGGDANISGNVARIVVARGTATLAGATVGSLLVVNGTADLQSGTTVTGEVRTLDGSVTQEPGSVVQGGVTRLDGNAGALAVLLVPLFILLFIGLGLAALIASVLVAAFGARQVRSVESLISHEPGEVLVAGIVGSIALPLVSVLLVLTVVGAPVGIASLVLVLPAIAFLSWIVAAIWVGDWLVARRRGAPEPERPYVAAIVGVIALALAGLLPFVWTVATLFGFGGLLLAGWRMFRGGGSATLPVTPAAPSAPLGPSAPIAPSAPAV